MSGLRKLRRLLTASAGYSLIELLITVIILGTVIGALTVLFVRASNSEVDMNRRFQAQLTVRQALDEMRREIHCSSGITPTGATNSISVTLPAQCPTAGGSLTTVTYDTTGSGQRWQLRRNSVNLADYVTIQNVFNYTAPVGGTSLGKLTVTLPINTTPSNSAKEWKVVGDIVLRNTTR